MTTNHLYRRAIASQVWQAYSVDTSVCFQACYWCNSGLQSFRPDVAVYVICHWTKSLLTSSFGNNSTENLSAYSNRTVSCAKPLMFALTDTSRVISELVQLVDVCVDVTLWSCQFIRFCTPPQNMRFKVNKTTSFILLAV